MKLEHVALWTRNLEILKDFYCKYFEGEANALYTNEAKQFHSYFITFSSGARLELMSKPSVPQNTNDRLTLQHLGLIHLAFSVETKEKVDEIAVWFKNEGLPILSGPRKTGDNYYEFETLDPDGNRIEVTSNF